MTAWLLLYALLASSFGLLPLLLRDPYRQVVAPSIAFDPTRGIMRCAQAVTKEIEADYHPDMKLGEQ